MILYSLTKSRTAVVIDYSLIEPRTAVVIDYILYRLCSVFTLTCHVTVKRVMVDCSLQRLEDDGELNRRVGIDLSLLDHTHNGMDRVNQTDRDMADRLTDQWIMGHRPIEGETYVNFCVRSTRNRVQQNRGREP